MAVTETKEVKPQSWIDQMGNAMKGIVTGLVLFVVGFPLLFWNEGRAVKTANCLEAGLQSVIKNVPTDKIDPANEGKLVHVTGLAATSDILADDAFAVSANAIKLSREVEIYQWVEDAETHTRKEGNKTYEDTTYTHALKWVPEPVDSTEFHLTAAERGKIENPPVSAYNDVKYTARNVTLGVFKMPQSRIERIGGSTAMPIPQDAKLPDWIAGGYVFDGKIMIPYGAKPATVANVLSAVATAVAPAPASAPDPAPVAEPVPASVAEPAPTPAAAPAPVAEPQSAATTAATSLATTIATSAVQYAPPKPGDQRVSFRIVPQHDVSIVAMQTGETFAEWSNDGQTLFLQEDGVKSAEELFGNAESKNVRTTWLFRFLGFFAMYIGLKMVLGPLTTLVSKIPILNGLVSAGASLAAFLVAAAGTCLTVGIAWVYHRPVMGCSLLAVAAVLAILALKNKKS